MLSLYIFKFHDIIIMFYVFYIIQYDIFNHLGGIVKKKILAFTLAETLIVMGVIGVVAALTLPNLNSSTGDKEKVVKVKKIYQNLNDAIGRAVAIYGPLNEWDYLSKGPNGPKFVGERITEFMKISKICIAKNMNCFSSSKTKVIDGNESTSSLDSYGEAYDSYRVITADGTSLLFNLFTPKVIVDIDGPNKGANTWGKDLFQFNINLETNDLSPLGLNSNITQIKEDCKAKGAELNKCAAWIILNDNMDYLKCPDKLSETVISCK